MAKIKLRQTLQSLVLDRFKPFTLASENNRFLHFQVKYKPRNYCSDLCSYFSVSHVTISYKYFELDLDHTKFCTSLERYNLYMIDNDHSKVTFVSTEEVEKVLNSNNIEK